MSHSYQKTSNNPRIAILLSTYNGEKYLSELLESLLAQEFHNWDLWVRDDGSTDLTTRILVDFKEHLSKIRPKNRVFYSSGENLGVVRSFISLLCLAHTNSKGPKGSTIYDGYAFCDQDDIWCQDKLSRAVNHLNRHFSPLPKVTSENYTNSHVPFLYHSRQKFIDDEGHIVGLSRKPSNTSFANALIQNQIVGCTMVIDNLLCDLIIDEVQSMKLNSELETIIMHDWWCYLVASGFGQIIYDPVPTIYFRRHKDNRTPMTSSRVRAWLSRAIAIKKRDWSVTHILQQAILFSRLHDTLKSQPHFRLSSYQANAIRQLTELHNAGFLKRFYYLITGKHYRSTPLETLLFRIMILFSHNSNG